MIFGPFHIAWHHSHDNNGHYSQSKISGHDIHDDVSFSFFEGSGYWCSACFHEDISGSSKVHEESDYYSNQNTSSCTDYHADTSCPYNGGYGFYAGQNKTGCSGHKDESCSEGSDCRLCEYQFSLKSLPEVSIFRSIIPVINGRYKETAITELHQRSIALNSPRAPPFQARS